MQLPELFKIKKASWLDENGRRTQSTTPVAIKVRQESKDWYTDIPEIESARARIERRRLSQSKPKRKRVRLCQDKRAAREMLREMIETAERGAAGIVDYRTTMQQSTGCFFDGFRAHLLAKGDSEEYVELTISRIEAVFAGCRFLRLCDLDAEKAATWLHYQRQQIEKPGFSVRGKSRKYKEIADAFDISERTVTYWRQQGCPIIPRGETDLAEVSKWLNIRNCNSMGSTTSNHYVTALRGFGRWLATKAKAVDKSPFESLEKIDSRSDIRKKRRVLEPELFAKFIDAALGSDQVFRGLRGIDRAMLLFPCRLYRVASK